MLLCDFHIHTTYSDGVLPLPKVVDLFGQSGHDVIAITDHIVNQDSGLGKIGHAIRHSLDPESWKRYADEVEREARRAWAAYGMVVIPGAEMTRNTINRDTSVHVLALGLDAFLSADGDPIEMIREIRDRGAVSVACHPHEMSEWFANTWYLWNRRKRVAPLLDLWEVGCRWELFPVIPRENLPHIANSDFHRPEHLYAWKTLLKCGKTREEVLAALKRGTGIGMLRLTPGGGRRNGMNAFGLWGLAGLACSAAAYAASAAFLLGARRRARGEPIAGWEPPVSILKPLSGVDDGLEENLESLFRLDYGSYEVIFSFASPQDAAYPVARAVADRHPRVPSTFVFDPREPGGNAKVNRLCAALRHARHRLLLFSDGNVRVRADFLRRGVSWFRDPAVGLVSHLFRATGAESIPSRIETLYLNGCLQGGTALVAGLLRIPCVVGKSILVSRAALDAIGGIAALRDHLAEDFLLGRYVRRAGYRVVLSADVLDTAEVRKGARAVWARHRRWAMMRRRLGGPLYAGELFAGPLPWFAIAMLSPDPGTRIAAFVLLALRYGLEAGSAAQMGRGFSVLDFALLPVRDLGALGVFWAGVVGSSVSWRGRPLRIGPQTLILGAWN